MLQYRQITFRFQYLQVTRDYFVVMLPAYCKLAGVALTPQGGNSGNQTHKIVIASYQPEEREVLRVSHCMIQLTSDTLTSPGNSLGNTSPTAPPKKQEGQEVQFCHVYGKEEMKIIGEQQ